MKTQIARLVNGEKRIIRDASHSKYLTAKKASSHEGYAGTNRNERLAIANQVIEENPDNLIIEVKGKRYTLDKVPDMYVSDISAEDFASITGNKPLFEYEAAFHLTITNSMKVYIDMFTRKDKDKPFTQRGTVYIDEAFVTII